MYRIPSLSVHAGADGIPMFRLSLAGVVVAVGAAGRLADAVRPARIRFAVLLALADSRR
jgi:hypothetical protein